MQKNPIQRLWAFQQEDIRHMHKRPQHTIALIGMMGTGKSHIGQKLAKILALPFVDTDILIAQEQGKSVARLFQEQGEFAFREIEAQAIERLLNDGTVRILATGGGCITTPALLESLKEHSIVVWLKSSIEDIYERIKDDDTRPLLQTENPLATLETLLAARRPLYAQAHITVETVQNSPEETLQAVINALQAYL